MKALTQVRPHSVAVRVGKTHWFWSWLLRRMFKMGFTVFVKFEEDDPWIAVVEHSSSRAVKCRPEAVLVTLVSRIADETEGSGDERGNGKELPN